MHIDRFLTLTLRNEKKTTNQIKMYSVLCSNDCEETRWHDSGVMDITKITLNSNPNLKNYTRKGINPAGGRQVSHSWVDLKNPLHAGDKTHNRLNPSWI